MVLLLAGQPASDPGRASRLFLQALDQDAELNLDSALVLLRSARDADPSNLPIHLEYIARATYWTPEGLPGVREEYAHLPDTPVIRCLRTYLEVTPELLHVLGPALLEMEGRGEGGGCPTVLLAMVLGDMRPHRVWEPRRIEYFERALSLFPEVSGLWTQYSSTLAGLGRFRDAAEVLRDGARALRHPVQRIPLNMRRAGMIFLAGDTASAVELRKAVASAVSRDGRPGIRLHYLRENDAPLGVWESRSETPLEVTLTRLADFARDHGAWTFEWQARFGLGKRLSGSGEPTRAIKEFNRAITIADSVGVPRLQVQTYYKRGRVLSDMDQKGEAEEDLRFAVEIAPASHSPYFVAEAWHNLLQVYSDSGRLEEALLAADRFLDAAEPLKHSPLRWAAHLMAGEIRWKLGWHAAANEALETAISVIDEHEEYHSYGGRYFERQGDLAKAREYFQKGVEAFGGGAESVREENWAGLARVFLELGQLDSAVVAARAHDEEIKMERTVPLVPLVLAEQRQLGQAVELSSRWAERRLSGQALAGAALAHLQWSELSLRAGDADVALAVALTADSLAQLMDLQDESIQAGRLRGLALAAQGDTEEALGILRETAKRATGYGAAETYRLSQLALAQELRGAGQTNEALVAFEKAAERVLETTSGFGGDLDRVRYRARHLSPYDGAVLTLIQASGRDDRIRELAAWSQKRKAAALRLSLSNAIEVTNLHDPDPIGEIQSRLRETEAVVDFQELDGSVWAMVLRKEFSGLRKLPISSGTLATKVDSLVGPYSLVFGGKIDLARAPFDHTLSNELYRSIWVPILDVLQGVDRVFLVPDGHLHRVPFSALVSALPDQQEEESIPGLAGSRFLLDDFELLYLPSMGFLPNPSWAGTFDPKTTKVLAVAGAAPGADEEVEGIAQTWPWGNVDVLSGAGASESRALSRSGKYDILHFATHAVADDRDPLASHLKLSSDSESDGLLHPVEISGIPAGRLLVILSACETQAGKTFRGEGLMGLSRAFMAAGAEAVVASRWLVGGQASHLMSDFHRQLSRGAGTAAALRYAQLAARSRPETAHPFFWAGFVLHIGGAL